MILAIPLFLLVGRSFLEVPLRELEALFVRCSSLVQLNLASSALIRRATSHHVRIIHFAISFFHRVVQVVGAICTSATIFIKFVHELLSILESLLLPLHIQVDIVVVEQHATESICDLLSISDMLHKLLVEFWELIFNPLKQLKAQDFCQFDHRSATVELSFLLGFALQSTIYTIDKKVPIEACGGEGALFRPGHPYMILVPSTKAKRERLSLDFLQ